MRTTAKGKTILTASLATLVGVSSIGCKSMPSLAFWKTAKKDAAATAVAQAPALPSDVALKTEGLATTTTAPPKGTASPFSSAAPPYTASAAAAGPVIGTPTAGGYPSTGVPAGYPSTSTAAPSYAAAAPKAYPSTAGSYPSTAPSYASAPTSNGSNLGSIAMPYNPNAVPPAATTAAAPATPAPAANRYGAPSTPSYGTASNVASTPGPIAPRYVAPTGTAPAPAFNATVAAPAPGFIPGAIQSATNQVQSATNQVNNTATTLASAVGDRYSQAVSIPATVTVPAPSTPAPVAQAKPATQAPATQTPATQTVATSQPYRPGGTGTYPTAKQEGNGYEVAERPGTPATTPAPAATPQAPRYW